MYYLGGHREPVWRGGSFGDIPATSLEAWFVERDYGVAMLYEFKQPGLYGYLNHNLFEAIVLSAAAHINVGGEGEIDGAGPRARRRRTR